MAGYSVLFLVLMFVIAWAMLLSRRPGASHLVGALPVGLSLVFAVALAMAASGLVQHFGAVTDPNADPRQAARLMRWGQTLAQATVAGGLVAVVGFTLDLVFNGPARVGSYATDDAAEPLNTDEDDLP